MFYDTEFFVTFSLMLCTCENNTFDIFPSTKITACDDITIFKRINLQSIASFSVL